MELGKITSFLDRELNIAAFRDSSHNGLQVENSGCVRKICVGVDASLEFFRKAVAKKADLLICHHGLSWGDSLKRITGLHYRRLRCLLDHDVALYACHLPLDAHPRLGNNAGICRALGLGQLKPFGIYEGMTLGYRGLLPRAIPYPEFRERATAVFGNMVATLEFGPARVRSVAVVSGGAADEIAQAGEAGVDVYVSGEPKLAAYSLAQEYGIHALFAGHYATEVFGVQAVARLLADRFPVDAEFIDLGICL